MYDATIQAYGGLDDLGKILAVLPSGFDINESIPFSTVLPLEETQDFLARKFRASGVQIATVDDEVPHIPGMILQEQGDYILQEQTDNISQE